MINKNAGSVGIINNKNEENIDMKNKECPVAKKELTEAEIASLTDNTVKVLNQLETSSVEGWIAMGKAVHDYIYSLHPKGQFKEDPYKKLSEHPDSVHRSSQLRNYEACYDLFVELGGKEGAPKVTMTHFIQILPRKINFEAKRKLLLKAEKEKMSVSDLKLHISEGKSGSGQEPTIIHNYGNDLHNCLRNLGDIISHITLKNKKTISNKTRSQIVFSIQHLITLNVITFEEINAAVPMKKAA